jgi:hypothetical protein
LQGGSAKSHILAVESQLERPVALKRGIEQDIELADKHGLNFDGCSQLIAP